MLKYVTIAMLIIIGVILFVDKGDLFSKYSTNNLATVSESDHDDYVEPVRNLGKVKVLVEKSTSTKTNIVLNNITPGTTKNPSQSPFYNSAFPVVWNFYLDNKFWYDNRFSFPAYSSQTFYLVDETWDFWQKNGFFIGTKIGNDYYLNKGKTIWNIMINGPTELNTYFQSCARLFPEHVFFKSVDDLERKLVKFANNKGDSKLKIKAKGEVAAQAIVYSDGGVCAKFTEGCDGGVSCNKNDVKTFFTAYKGKSIRQVLDYHTHDLNSSKFLISKGFKDFLLYENGKYLVPIPSDGDLYASFWQKKDKWASILGTGDIIEKVISANGAGYIYDAPANKKSNNLFMNDEKYVNYDTNILKYAKSTLSDLLVKNNRKKTTNEDVLSLNNSLLNLYKKDLGASFSPFTVR